MEQRPHKGGLRNLRATVIPRSAAPRGHSPTMWAKWVSGMTVPADFSKHICKLGMMRKPVGDDAVGDDAKVLGAPQSIRDDFAAKASYGD